MKKAILTLALLLAMTPFAHAQTTGYSNIDTFSGQGFANGGAATLSNGNTITQLVADDIALAPGLGGGTVTAFTFSVVNFDAADVSARARVRFFATDGAGGGPGTLITGLTFNPITFTSGSVGLFTATLAAANQFALPANGNFWAGITFDNNTGGTGATAAQLNNLGQGLYNPPTVGSSGNVAFQTTPAGSAANGVSFLVNNPDGTTFNFGNATDPPPPVANFGWAFQIAPVPAPSGSIASLLGLGVLALTAAVRRRRAA